MSLELRNGRDGKLRPYWYGRFDVDGRRHCVSLGVKITGTPPASLREQGDPAFERSRGLALAKLEEVSAEARKPFDAARLVQKIYELKCGEKVNNRPLADLKTAWQQILRKRKPSTRYALQSQAVLERFATYVLEHYPQAQDISQITRTMGLKFLEAEETRGVTAKTWNDVLLLLRTAFRHLLPPGAVNPFQGIPTHEVETVFRKPFTPEELKVIVDTAREDHFLRPLVITGICTAMRRGDCCLLKWEDVDMQRRFITVKTNKTGQTVSIPVFPMLFDELTSLPRETAGYVFPRQAETYLRNPVGLTRRVRRLFAAAGFKDTKTGTDGEKTDASVRGEIHVKRAGGLRLASVRDFHSFRVTWVTLALTAGVPLELVQKVTGHKTTDVVLKHYFQPGREEFRRLIQTNMPALLTSGQNAPGQTPKEQALEILAKTSARKWKSDSEKLKSLLSAMEPRS